MNTKQKAAVFIGIIFVCAVAFYPVWSIKIGGIEVKTTRSPLYSSGYSVLKATLWKGKDQKGLSVDHAEHIKVRVDYGRMVIEVVVAGILTCGAVIFFKRESHGKSNQVPDSKKAATTA